jgi:rhodanese-related sulfurtransferase
MPIVDPAQPVPRDCGCQPARILREALLVGVIGAALAFLANQISPRGLDLATNYFPGGDKASEVRPPIVVPSRGPGGTNAHPSAPSPAEVLAARLKKEGLQLVERAEAEKLYHDPRLQQNLIMFIDARDEDDYQAGHIPGAFEFNPYHSDKYLASVLTPCQLAEQIIVYCTGGDCEDSQSAALFLRDAGVTNSKLFIYGGGIAEWEAARLPVETGPRNSGNLRNPGP